MLNLKPHLHLACQQRADFIADTEVTAYRLFSGFYEGAPALVVDVYGQTIVMMGYAPTEVENTKNFELAQIILRQEFPEKTCIIQKYRTASDSTLRRGQVSYGSNPDQKVLENGIWYALDIQMNQDASFYLDTRNLRSWLSANAAGWQVLNTFAYTGSLGVAALAGGAKQVVQTDRNHKFLAVARQSGILNRLDIGKMKLRANDFFSEIARLKRSQTRFDCVIVDPPFFSSTKKGTVNLVNESVRVINKVRPLIRDGGYLITINNALFLSGADYYQGLVDLCSDGYLKIQTLIPIPADITGFPATIVVTPPTDPAPFNHSTKIAILRVKKK
jgi:23S rRNA (cytosine1962-C5)-methyltransferase